MAQIKSEAAYRAAMKRIDELLKVVNDSTPEDDPNYLELDMISDMVAEYEDVHYPISKPTLIDVIKLRLYEMGITQTKLAEMLGLSNARVSEIMNGKSEPSLKIGREISRKLNIDPAVVLGVWWLNVLPILVNKCLMRKINLREPDSLRLKQPDSKKSSVRDLINILLSELEK